jgi:hypothetical protein
MKKARIPCGNRALRAVPKSAGEPVFRNHGIQAIGREREKLTIETPPKIVSFICYAIKSQACKITTYKITT